jgi:HIRAN domain-containing protein
VWEEAGFWRRLFGLDEVKKEPVPAAHPGHSMSGKVVTGQPVDWSRYDDCMRVSVVGESHYQDALIRVSKCPPTGEHGYECAAELVLEPDNPYDKFAVKVMVDGLHVGYLPKGTAKRLGKRLRGLATSGRRAVCMAYIGRAASGNPNLGISLRIPYDGEILQGRR